MPFRDQWSGGALVSLQLRRCSPKVFSLKDMHGAQIAKDRHRANCKIAIAFLHVFANLTLRITRQAAHFGMPFCDQWSGGVLVSLQLRRGSSNVFRLKFGHGAQIAKDRHRANCKRSTSRKLQNCSCIFAFLFLFLFQV
jgi:hypothetical protein